MDRLTFAIVGVATAQYYAPESRGISKFARQFFPGGAHSVTFKDSFNSTYNPYAFRGPLIVHPDGLKEQTFLSAPIDMTPGEVVNNYVPVNWPEGRVHIKSYSGDIVKLAPGADAYGLQEDGFPEVVEATREEVYLHHWTLNKWQMGKEQYDSFVQKGRDFMSPMPDVGQTHGANTPCGLMLLHFIFGAGNEVRGPPPSGANATYHFPDPYGIESNSDEMHEKGILMLFNAHLIDIRGVDNIRGCTECECSVMGIHKGHGWLANYTGGLECCHSTAHDHGRCPSKAAPDVRSYFIKYTLTWRDADDGIYANEAFKPLNVMTLDQSDDGARWFDPVGFPGTSRQSHTALHKDPTSMASLEGRHSGMQGEDGHVHISFDVDVKHKPHVTPKINQDIHGCHVEYYVPECGSGEQCVHRFQNSWKMPYDLEVVAVHSHFHNAAINMTTSVQGGETICAGLPTYDSGFLVETSKCAIGYGLAQPVHVKRGQSIHVETFYEQDDRPHFGVMGYSMVYVHRLDLEHGSDSVMV